MEAKYYNDTLHSYMIIPCPPEAETTGYQYRMLEMNRIDGILPCGIRHIDGAGFLYYETTGRQSLISLYEGRKVPGPELFRLLKSLDRVSGTLSEYLLDEQHLVLTEDQIFYDISSGKYCFTYYPGEVVSPEVFRFLAQSIDGKEKQAAAAAYRLYAAAGDSRQVLRQAVREEAAQKDTPRPWEQVLEEHSPKSGAFGKIGADYGSEERYPALPEPEPGRSHDAGKFSAEEALPESGRGGSRRGEKTGNDHLPQTGKKQLVIRILLIVILLAGSGGLFAVQLLVYISQRERRLCIAGSILLLISACLIIAEMVLRLRERQRKRRAEEANRKPSYSESDEKDFPVFRTQSAEDYRLSDDETGNTVRFSEQESIGRLYGRDRGSRIDLRTLPVTVGKAQAYVDTVLSDPSVSRVHARIYKGEEGGILIRDLNSTNGTFINGTRLEPNEKKRVQRGDEVRFGNMEFEYR